MLSERENDIDGAGGSPRGAPARPSSRRYGIEQGGSSHEETGSDGVRLALGARGESIARKEVTEGGIDANILV